MNIIENIKNRFAGKDAAATAIPAEPEQKLPIGADEVRAAYQILQEYKNGKANLESRIIDNEQWFKMRHWAQMRGKGAKDSTRPEPASAWLFNSIANKHADAMDNYPEPVVLPREEQDKQDAEQLSKILPVLLEYNDFEDTYSDSWWYKLKSGTAVYGVLWNKQKENGLGDIDVKKIDILNCFWEPGVQNIQDSRNFFTIELVDNDLLEQQYPQLRGKLVGNEGLDVSKYIYDDAVDTSKKSSVIDWYYKLNVGGKTTLQYVKFVEDTVLFASENEKNFRENGLYDHGLYPFVFDTLFLEEGTPCGFGYVDVMKDTQMYLDKLNQAIIEHTMMSAKKRYLVPLGTSINEEEFADFSKTFIHTTGTLDDRSIKEIKNEPLGSAVVTVYDRKIEELKETSGNRDFSQGGTTSGVTAASAIAALQEAGSKLSRDMLKSSYRAYAKVCRLVVELIRQFYDEPRCFRITGENGSEMFTMYDNRNIRTKTVEGGFGVESSARKPIFDINIIAQKKSAFSRISQNELAKELYGAGMFNPQMADQALVALDMMDFEGKNAIVSKVSQNGTLFQRMQQMQAQMMQMAQIIDSLSGSQLSASLGDGVAQPMPSGSAVSDGKGQGDLSTAARDRAMNAAKPE